MASMLSAAPATCRTSFLGHGIPCRKLSTVMGISFINQRASKNPISLSIECSSRPRKKATAHHVKTRPKKHQPYDKNRKGPTKHPPLPKRPLVIPSNASNQDENPVTGEQISAQDEKPVSVAQDQDDEPVIIEHISSPVGEASIL
eukprot:Gb_06980 [translate_table: standard]